MIGKCVAVLCLAAALALVAVQMAAGEDAPAASQPGHAGCPWFGERDCLFYARWGCVFAGLAMVGVIWVGWSLRTIAKNQVELGRLILEVAKRD